MDFVGSSVAEGSLAAALGNALVVALADLLDDGTGASDRKDAVVSFSGERRGDCLGEAAASSLRTIVECATMKTDNTTAASVSAPPFEDSPLLPPCAGETGERVPPAPTGSYRCHRGRKQPREKDNHGSAEEKEEAPSPGAGVGVRVSLGLPGGHEKEPGESKDDGTQSTASTTGSTSTTNSICSTTGPRANQGSSRGFLCGTLSLHDDEMPPATDWSPPSAFWCGGVPAVLTYESGLRDERQDEGTGKDTDHERAVEAPPPLRMGDCLPFFASCGPQHQFAFDDEDENDGDDHKHEDAAASRRPGLPAPGRAVVEDDAGTTATAGSATTGASSSLHSFLVVDHPHPLPSPSGATVGAHRGRSFSATADETFHRRQRPLHRWMAPGSDSESDSPREGHRRRSQTPDPPSDRALVHWIMRGLKPHLPYSKKEDSFFLGYSLLRDGASLDRLLDAVGESQCGANCSSVLAVETTKGEVFGAFLTEPWKRSGKRWFGGGQSFLWTTCETGVGERPTRDRGKNRTLGRRNRVPPTTTTPGQQQQQHHLEVFPYSFANPFVQLCDGDRLLVGSGEDGFGLALEGDLTRGSTSACETFASPPLSRAHRDGLAFGIRALEVWTLAAALPFLSPLQQGEGVTRVRGRSPGVTPGRNKAATATEPPSPSARPPQNPPCHRNTNRTRHGSAEA
ncbi:unnamed protein product [Pseudo-nitzschia multistriata]|uniref:Oxidation resistance protein 1 n=1 Tax=Pseudo-nitzschia multistriata TaxID=183589 RepID=A0A448ZC72_9STRA|nr:unnamed protein product [Pseudo-nitzschia multistriata]